MVILYSCSCEKKGGDNPKTEDFILSKSSIEFAKDGGTQEFSVKTEGTVAVACTESWLSVVQKATTSATMHTYQVTVQANTVPQERSCMVTVNVGSKSATVTISQAAADGLTIENHSPESLTFEAEGGLLTVNLQSNGDYKVALSSSWISQTNNTKAQMTASSRTFAIAKNYSSERNGTISFTLGNITQTLDISQKKYEGGNMSSSATELASKMFAGINIGNTLEATGGETAWGNPYINETYISALKAAGFNAVRIPCAWNQYIEDPATYKLKDSWLERVNEVVSYVVAQDMYAIVNIHWDEGWLENNISKGYDQAIDNQQKALWTQIANTLKNYDEHLLFAGCNEPNADNETHMATLRRYEQTFVDAVRATGGNNAARCLVIQGPNTDVDKTCEFFGEMPTDIVADRLLLEVHFYSPYNFCMMTEDADWGNMFFTWGVQNHVEGSTHNPTWGEEDYLKEQFRKIKTLFTDKGIPTILGEYSAMFRNKSDYFMTEAEYQAHLKSVAYYNECVTREAKNHGLVPFYWDTGSLINRTTGAISKQDITESIIKGATEGNYPF